MALIKSKIIPKAGEKVYEAAFKKRDSGNLLWVHGSFKDSSEAREKLRAFVQEKHPNEGYNLYGGPLEEKSTEVSN